MTRWLHILFYGLRAAYLEAVHRRVLETAPHHQEVSTTWRELQRARAEFDAAWGS
ncbi:MAG: hypothetical protein J0H00_15715 [Burkholderiales bacterium]|nr:hypothetical protein [Burkholderiales bacterium]